MKPLKTKPGLVNYGMYNINGTLLSMISRGQLDISWYLHFIAVLQYYVPFFYACKHFFYQIMLRS